MKTTIRESINQLVQAISSMDGIIALGQTSDINLIPEPGQSDIDIFVYGDHIPSYEVRKQLYDQYTELYEKRQLQVCEGGVWGSGDIFIIGGVETMFMYFQIDETLAYLEEILEGKHPDIINGFYPLGRCSTLLNMYSLYDSKNLFPYIKKKLSIYPEFLSMELIKYHLNGCFNEEDFGRALLRQDVLFYHQVLEHALDHFLQALFAANKTYFPSRKRTKAYLDRFTIQPYDCYNRINEVIRYSCEPEGIRHSVDAWTSLVDEFRKSTRKE